MTAEEYDKAMAAAMGLKGEVSVDELTTLVGAVLDDWGRVYPGHEVSLPRYIASHLLHRFSVTRREK